MMEFRDININEVIFNKRRGRIDYSDVYEHIFALNIGDAFEVTLDNNHAARALYSAVYQKFKREGVSDNYLKSFKKNKFYCGRIK